MRWRRLRPTAYFAGRPGDRLSRRICGNVLITADSPDTASGTTYFVTCRVDGHRPGHLVPPPPPADLGHYEDSFRRLDGQWLLDRRRLVLPFGGPTTRLRDGSWG
ncbi:nuclear transport factor 2 family protein [Streptomyces sp. NPDC058045]|uniref:nuclear transport factor 2 family protein n=1 Tax=Streptomyces sp. NPDC058045 TaxID=3346311 RepID=UPI0036EFCBBD